MSNNVLEKAALKRNWLGCGQRQSTNAIEYNTVGSFGTDNKYFTFQLNYTKSNNLSTRKMYVYIVCIYIRYIIIFKS